MARYVPPLHQVSDANGLPLVGGEIYFYAAGTTTPKATYSDALKTTANTNPVVLNARGEPATDIYLGVGDYKVVYKDAAGVTLRTFDDVGVPIEGTITPEMFGATYDGTDDYEAVRDALAFLSDGGTLMFTTGRTYTILTDTKLEVTDGIQIIGGGTIAWASDRTQPIFEVQEDCAAEFYGLTFDGGYTTSTTTSEFTDLAHAIIARGVRRLRVMHCRFQDCKGDGVYIGETANLIEPRDVVVKWNQFHNIKRNSFACVVGIDIHCDENIITSDSDFVSNISSAIDFEPNGPRRFINCTARGNRIDVYGSAAPLRLDVGTAKEMTECRGFDFSGNDVRSQAVGAVAGCSIGILVNANMVTGGGDDIRINNNIVHGATTCGVWALRCGKNTEIIGNDIRESDIFIRATNHRGDHLRIIGNRGYRDDASLDSYAIQITLNGTLLENLWIQENSFIDAVGATVESIFVSAGTTVENVWMDRNKTTGWTLGQRVYEAVNVHVDGAVCDRLVVTSCTSVNVINCKVTGEAHVGSNTTVWFYYNAVGSWTRTSITNLFYGDSTIGGSRTNNEGFVSGTTDGSGDLTVTHGMMAAPLIVMAAASGVTFRQAQPHSVDATTFKVRIMDDAAAAVTATAVNIHWRARIA